MIKIFERIVKKIDTNKSYQIKVIYMKNIDKLKIICNKSYEDRAIKTLELFLEAFENVKTKINNDFIAFINTDDICCTSKKMLAYSCDGNKENIVLIPDFVFANWKEIGYSDYDFLCKQIVEESKKHYIYNKLFWIGNENTHKTRRTLLNIASQDNRIEAIGMNWEKKKNNLIPTKFVSLVDHTKFKYLIDIQGRGYSGRTKILLFSGRPLFICDRKCKEYWQDDIKPFIHYIPVKEDLSDLIEKLDWAEHHYDEANKIALRAQEYAINNLTKKSAIKRMCDVIINISNS